MSSTSTFSTNTLQTIHSAFSSNIDYSSIDTGKQTIALVNFIGNPNFSGLGVSETSLIGIYDGLIYKLRKFISDVSNDSVKKYKFGKVLGFRIVVTVSDGTVFFDSSLGSSNTYENFLNCKISENFNTRSSVHQAIHSKEGIGYETRWSSITKGLETFYSVR